MNQEKTKVFAAVTARDVGAAQSLGLPCLGLFYRIGENGALQRARVSTLGRGGLLGLYEAPGLALCQPDRVARDIQAECARRGLEGAVLDLNPGAEDISRLEGLCAALRRLQVPLWVPEELARTAGPGAVVICPASVSGGSFDSLLEALCARWGRENLCLDVERLCRDFSMPADSPEGTPLSPADFARLWAGREGFFDSTLCCKYFTYRREGEARFVLYDDPSTAAEKLRRIRRAGIPRACLLWSEWGREMTRLAEE